ncbi:phage tail spike protein, partial [Pseudolactococcus raffinolactis]
MINLYKKDETTFEHNGLGSLDHNILNPEISWKDNGAFTLEFRYPLFAKHGFEIENSSIVRANDPEGSNLFFVYKITPSMGYVTVLCYQISYKLAFNSINDTNIVDKSGQNALNQMGNSTQYPHSFTFSSDIQTTATSRVVRKNPIEFLLDTGLDNSFVNRWGGHIVRHNFNISMNSAYGSNKGYTIRHKKDLKGYEAEFDESTVITRVRPVGYDGLLLPEIYVDSELIEAYTEPRIQQIEYSNVKVKTKDSDEEGFSTKELAYAELRRLANLEFSENKVDQPDFSAKVEFVNLKDTQEYKDLKSLKQILPGDTVKVIHEEDNFSIEAQMVEYKWNPLNQSYISITLGNYTKSFTSTVGKSLQTNLNQVAQQAQSAMNTANGKNTVYSLTYKPAITKSSVEGDLLYLKNGDKTELWILKLVNGKLQWVLQVSDATQEELKAQMAQAKTDIVEAVDSANSAVDKANASVTAVQANTQLINDVNTVANNAKTQAQTAVTNAQTAITNAQTALTSANTANTNANKAIGDVGKLSEDVLALDTIANQAKSDADTALINANKGITDAKTALNKAIGVDTRVTTEITNVSNTLATKANSTTVDAI